MFKNVVFTALGAFIISSVSVPGGEHRTTVSALSCPAGRPPSQHKTPAASTTSLESYIHSRSEVTAPLTSFKYLEEAYIHVDAESVYCYEDQSEIFVMSTVTLWWKNDILCWNPADYAGVTSVDVSGAILWTPRLVSTTKSIPWFNLPYQVSDCTVQSNGTVGCRFEISLSGPCRMHLRGWPRSAKAECWISLDILHPEGRQKLLHRDDRTGREWLSSAELETAGQFRAVDMRREANDRNGVIFRFLLEGTATPLANAVTSIAAILSVVIIASFALPAGSAPRMCLLGCACLSLLLSIGFLADQLVAVTPDTPVIVKLHCDVLVVAGFALLASTLLAPRLTAAKPFQWQLTLRRSLLSSSIGRFALVIFRVPHPADDGPQADLNVSELEDGAQRTSFRKEEASDAKTGREPTRALIFTLADRLVAAVCGICLISLWLSMIFVTESLVW